MYKVIEVKNKKERELFEKLPKRIYNKYDLTQDISTEHEILTGAHVLNKYFQIFPYIVTKENEVVSRAALTIYPDDSIAYIGFFESINDSVAVKLLFDEIERLAKSKKIKTIQGPVDASFWIKYRLKINKFDKEPYTAEPYNKEYYLKFFMENGYLSKMHYVSNTFPIVTNEVFDSSFEKRLEDMKRKGYTIVSPKANEFENIIKQVYKLIIKLYSDFPAFKFIEENDFLCLFKKLKLIIKYNMVKIAYKENEVAGFFISIPNYQNAVYSNINYLKLLKTKLFPKEYVMLYMGVDAKHKGLGMALTESIRQELYKNKCSSIGALVMDGKKNKKYYQNFISEQYEYLLLEKSLV